MAGGRDRVRARLEHPRLPLHLAVVAFVLCVPSLFGGLQIDDWWHRVILTRTRFAGVDPPPRLWMFDAFRGDAEWTRRAIDHGMGAWWAEPNLRVSFFRPLTAALHVLDYALYPDAPLLMHLHSAIWFVACVALGAAAYRRILGKTWVFGVAALLFTLDPTHGMSAGWIAQRNTLVTTAFGLGSLLAFDRWRRDGWRAGAIVSPLLFALGLLAGEAGLGVFGFVVAYELSLDDAPWSSRARALLSHLVVLGAWAFVYRHFRFGTHGSAMYDDPTRTPLRFLVAMLERAPVNLAAEIGGPPPDLWGFVGPRARAVMIAVAVVCMAVAALALVRTERRRECLFFSLGMLLAVVPISATTPGSRILFVVSFGGMGLIALMIEAWVVKRMKSRWARAWTIWAAATHVFLGAPLFVFASLQLFVAQRALFDHYASELPADASIERVVVVNPPDCSFLGLLLLRPMLQHAPAPQRVLGLAPGSRAVELVREDDRTVRVRAPGGFQQSEVDGLVRDPRDPMPIGTRVELTGVIIEVTSTTSDGRADEARFRFAAPLEDPSMRWMTWNGRDFVPFALPFVGARLVLPPTPLGG